MELEYYYDEESPLSRLEQAKLVAEELINDAEAAYKMPLADFDEIDPHSICLTLLGGFREIFSEDGERVWYEISEKRAQLLVHLSNDDPEIFDNVVRYCGSNLINQKPLPQTLQIFAGLVIQGARKRPAKRGRRRGNFFQRAFFLRSADWIAFAFEIPLTRNESSPPLSACDLVANAATKKGVSVSYETVRDWCTSKDYAWLREIAESFEHFVVQATLRSEGKLDFSLVRDIS